MLKKPLRYVALGIALACGAAIAIVGVRAALVPAVGDRTLATLDPCAPPCWYGITPGVTRTTEARAILASLPFVKRGTLYEGLSHDGSHSYLSWTYTQPNGGGSVTLKNDVVALIASRPDPALTLAEVVEALGPPERVVPEPVQPPDSADYYVMHIHFPDRGLLLSTSRLPPALGVVAGSEYTVDPSFPIGEALYFTPRAFQDIVDEIASPNNLERRSYMKEHAYPWQGYGSFPYSVLP